MIHEQSVRTSLLLRILVSLGAIRFRRNRPPHTSSTVHVPPNNTRIGAARLHIQLRLNAVRVAASGCCCCSSCYFPTTDLLHANQPISRKHSSSPIATTTPTRDSSHSRTISRLSARRFLIPLFIIHHHPWNLGKPDLGLFPPPPPSRRLLSHTCPLISRNRRPPPRTSSLPHQLLLSCHNYHSSFTYRLHSTQRLAVKQPDTDRHLRSRTAIRPPPPASRLSPQRPLRTLPTCTFLGYSPGGPSGSHLPCICASVD